MLFRSLALVVTVLHFVIVLGYTPLGRWISVRGHAEKAYVLTYEDGHGVLRAVLSTCTSQGWIVHSLAVNDHDGFGATVGADADQAAAVTIVLSLSGPGVSEAITVLGAVTGVVHVGEGDQE